MVLICLVVGYLQLGEVLVDTFECREEAGFGVENSDPLFLTRITVVSIALSRFSCQNAYSEGHSPCKLSTYDTPRQSSRFIPWEVRKIHSRRRSDGISIVGVSVSCRYGLVYSQDPLLPSP